MESLSFLVRWNGNKSVLSYECLSVEARDPWRSPYSLPDAMWAPPGPGDSVFSLFSLPFPPEQRVSRARLMPSQAPSIKENWIGTISLNLVVMEKVMDSSSRAIHLDVKISHMIDLHHCRGYRVGNTQEGKGSLAGHPFVE